jgi:dihydrofolate synthase/folylpolyglutamate synthase
MPVSPPLKLIDRPAGRIRPRLDNLRQVLSERGNPQLDFPSILIVGTNGKGSTAAMLEALLREHGLTTGLFTSPHLVRVEERVQVGGAPLDSEVFEMHVRRFDEFPDLTYFETVTGAAFTAFSEAMVDIAVLEAGMGGSWDATRLAESSVAGVTNIGSDHSQWLGSDPAAVAREKGQALAAADRAVVGSGVDESLLSHLGAPNAQWAKSLVSCADRGDGRVVARWNGGETLVRLPLAGAFQLENFELALALALTAANTDLVPTLVPRRVRVAVECVSWPGRLSAHPVGGPRRQTGGGDGGGLEAPRRRCRRVSPR